VSTVPTARASAGASTSTGSTTGGLSADVETAVYRRSGDDTCHVAMSGVQGQWVRVISCENGPGSPRPEDVLRA